MITGYNTDVPHGEIVFHVQTEDKGQANPTIESLVYVGGQVIAARRASYAEVLAGGGDEQTVLARMEKQHRTMIAAIRLGKFDRKLTEALAARSTAAPHPAGGDGTANGPPASAVPVPAPGPVGDGSNLTTAPASTDDDPLDRTLDQVILDYLASEAEQEQLVLILENAQLEPGRRGRLALRAVSSRRGQPVAGAEVGVRMISTVAEPRNLGRGLTDREGSLELDLDIPDLGKGTAALIVTAVSDLGRAELKQLL